MMRRLLVILGVGAAAWTAMAVPAAAHPLGNFSVNVYNGIVVARDEVRLDHVVDLAELPTVQAMPELDADCDASRAGGLRQVAL